MRLRLIAVECWFLRGRVALAAASSDRRRLRTAARAAARIERLRTPYGVAMARTLRAGLAARGVRRPERITAVLAPGFPGS